MYSTKSGLILGFHGTDSQVVSDIVNKKISIKPSDNNHDWLGNGIYFWEHNPKRALEFARMLKNNPAIAKTNPVDNPAIIGAVLNLGKCLDFTISENLKLLKSAYKTIEQSLDKGSIPVNHGGDDMVYRNLDCFVIETIHRIAGLDEFDSVRGVFWEGKDIYPKAGFKERNHIQICIRNPNCIKGFFLPCEIDKNRRPV